MGARKAIVTAIVALTVMTLTGCSAASGVSPASQSTASGSSAASVSSEASTSSSSADSGTLDPNNVPVADSVLPESEWGSLFFREGDKALEFGRRVQQELPIKAYVEFDGVAGGQPVEFTDPAQIRALYNALASANADQEVSAVNTDDYMQFWFAFEDNVQFGFIFDSMSTQVVEGGKYRYYNVEGGADLEWFVNAAKRQSWS